HYIYFSGIPDVGSVPTLSLSSHHDLMSTPHHATGASICVEDEAADGGTPDAGGGDGGAGDGGTGCNVIQHTFASQDHFAVAASKDSFVRLYRYLNGKDPTYTEVQCGDDPVTIVGVAETFADNVPVTGKIEVREMTTPRAAGAPDQVVTPDAEGH